METQGSDWTSGPVTLQCLIQSGARAALTTGATLSGLSLASRIFGRKAGGGVERHHGPV